MTRDFLQLLSDKIRIALKTGLEYVYLLRNKWLPQQQKLQQQISYLYQAGKRMSISVWSQRQVVSQYGVVFITYMWKYVRYTGYSLWSSCISLWYRSRACILRIYHHVHTVIQHYWPPTRYRVVQYALLIRLHKPIGTLLLLWPALWGLWIAAEGVPDTSILLIFIAGVFLMRSAGVIFNDIADRNIDRQVTRTQERPLAKDRIHPLEALVLAAVLLFFALLLVLQLNVLTQYLALVAMLLAATYPWFKRFTYLPQFYLGLCFGWSVPMAFAAQTNSIPEIAWVLMITNLLWTVVYDTIYAMMDKESDVHIGVKSTALLFAELDREIIAVLLLLVNTGFILVAYTCGLGWWFYAAMIFCLLLNVHQFKLISKRTTEAYMQAFVSNNCYGALIFSGIALSYIK